MRGQSMNGWKVFEEFTAKTITSVMKDINLQSQKKKKWETLKQDKPKESMSKHIIIKFAEDKEKIVKADRKKMIRYL